MFYASKLKQPNMRMNWEGGRGREEGEEKGASTKVLLFLLAYSDVLKIILDFQLIYV